MGATVDLLRRRQAIVSDRGRIGIALLGGAQRGGERGDSSDHPAPYGIEYIID